MLTIPHAHRLGFALAVVLPFVARAQGNSATPPATIASKTAGFERRAGFMPLYLDAKQGHLYAELPAGGRALYWISTATGLGSNPVGVDRGASGSDHVVRFD